MLLDLHAFGDESLVGMNSGQPWYDGWHGEIAEAELGLLREALRGYS